MFSATTEILVIFFLILLNGVFALSEIAIVSARKVRLEQLARDDRRAAVALKLANDPNQILSTVQIGITLVGIFAGPTEELIYRSVWRNYWPKFLF